MGSHLHNVRIDSHIPVLTDRVDYFDAHFGNADEPLMVSQADRFANPSGRPRSGFPWRLIVWGWVVVILSTLVWAAWYESETSYLQSRLLPPYAQRMTFEVSSGSNETVRYPIQGPFDERLGYVRLPTLLKKLHDKSFETEYQARFSPELQRYVNAGFYPPYREKTVAGLSILDGDRYNMYRFQYPRREFASFEEIPSLMVDALLFIENRHLLDSAAAKVNPAIDWGRFIKAAVFKLGDLIDLNLPSMGGSTLATQIEKYRHSDDGITSSIEEKLRQIASASVRVYQQGADTSSARRQLVLDYLNTVPLSAAPGFGEVNGIGDGLFVWFGADFENVKRLLAMPTDDETLIPERALALRQIISLMIAHRRPSYYLSSHREELAKTSDSYIRLLARNNAISQELMRTALKQTSTFRNFHTHPAVIPAVTNKGVNVVRNRLVSMLGVSLYDLDRMDLSVQTTLQKDIQEKVTAYLRSLRDEQKAIELGLVGEYLLKPGQSNDVRYSFTLFERTSEGNQVRVQTDNTEVPFDINEGSKLELGSTAKLRVLSTYLSIIAELYERVRAKDADIVAKDGTANDPLTRWTVEQLTLNPQLTLPELLQAALDRSYSANPAEVFFTGGGVHTFNNFKREDNGRVPTVRESLQESINLPFVRILRDIVSYITRQQWSDVSKVLKDDHDPRRQEVLSRFIDREGSLLLSRFWIKYQHKTAQERLDILLSGLKLTPVRLAVIYRYLYPEVDEAAFAVFVKEHIKDQALSDKTLQTLYRRYGPEQFNLQDQGYLARIHPLELWLLGFMQKENKVSLSRVLEESKDERQAVYVWLLRTKAKNARDSRIRTTLEVEAFTELHRRWQQLGYPFDHLVPSLATALGSSGDRPAALAELMGIILNGGERLPIRRVKSLVFAESTPYEVKVAYPPAEANVVMHPDVAHALKMALADVVNKGTARRLQDAYHHVDGTPLLMGGKTGTGDNRLVIGSGGQKSKARALSRTATLVFYLGERHFGTLTAFVPGSEAKNFRFTSALPAQALKSMAPILDPYLQESETLGETSSRPVEYSNNAEDGMDEPPVETGMEDTEAKDLQTETDVSE